MKLFKTSVLALTSVMVLATCGNSNTASTSDTASAQDNGELLVSTFAILEDVIQSEVFAPFTEAEGINITHEVGNSSERFTKLQNNPHSTIDVIELSQNNAASGVAEGMFEPLDEEKVPNLTLLVDGAQDAVDSAG